MFVGEDSEHWKRERSGGATDGIDLRIRKEDANASADPLHMFFAIMCCTMKKALDQRLGDLSDAEPPIRAEVMSFGFKRGLPRQADLVADVRFLPNPFYIESLCRHSGLDEDVRSFVMDHPTTQEFMRRYTELLDFLIPHYREEGKRRLVIAIGCTGGAHRSVAIAEAIGRYLREKGLPTEIDHRDLQLEQARWTTPVEEA